MNFDIISMRQRAKALMKGTSPNPKIVGIVFMIILMIAYAGLIITCATGQWLVLIITEIVCMNFRNSSKLYGLKVSREESTGIADAFAAFRDKPIQMILTVLPFGAEIIRELHNLECLLKTCNLSWSEKENIRKVCDKLWRLLNLTTEKNLPETEV